MLSAWLFKLTVRLGLLSWGWSKRSGEFKVAGEAGDGFKRGDGGRELALVGDGVLGPNMKEVTVVQTEAGESEDVGDLIVSGSEVFGR